MSAKSSIKSVEDKRLRTREAAARFADAAQNAIKEARLPEALKLVQDALALVEDSPRLHILHARVLAMLERPDDAKAAASAAYDWAFLKSNRFDEYRTYLEKELAKHPEVKEAFFQRGQDREKIRAAEAIERARDWKKKGNYREALKSYLDALASRSQDGPALGGIEKILLEEDLKEGLRYFESFREGKLSRKDLITLLTPTDSVPSTADEIWDESPGEKTLSDMVAEMERELEKGETEKSIAEPPADFKDFRKRAEPVLSQAPNVRIDLAIGYFEMGLVEPALEELRAVPIDNEAYLQARCLLGEFLLKTKQPLLALDAFQDCMRDSRLGKSEEKCVRYYLAQTYFELGDWARAAVEAEAVEKQDPVYRELRFLKAKIANALAVLAEAKSGKK